MHGATIVRALMSKVDRAAMVARWYELTRVSLPEMASRQGWPIRLDHCFMRVCLDTVLGAPWTDVIDRPAVRTMSDTQLAAAIAIAEEVAVDPARLPELNAASLRGRRASRSARAA